MFHHKINQPAKKAIRFFGNKIAHAVSLKIKPKKRRSQKMKRLAVLVTVVTFLFSIRIGSADPLTSTLKDQQDVAVTIYNSNIGLVKDTRLLNLKTGILELKFMDVAAKIDPTTVHIKSLVNGSGLSVWNRTMNMTFSPQALDKYVARRSSLKINPETKKGKIAEVTLSTQGEISFRSEQNPYWPHGRILLRESPISQPTLVWMLENKLSKPQKLEASYLTSGINWKADYVAVLNKSDTMTDLLGHH
jgi:hypothetical protein